MAVTPDHPREAAPAAPAPRGVRRETVELPRQRAGAPPRKPGAPPRKAGAPLPVAAVVTTFWAALLSALPVAVVVALAQLVEAPTISWDGVLRYGLAGWLLAHGVPLRTGLGPVGLAPLAVAALAAWRVARAGVHTTRAIGGRRTGSPRVALVAAATVGAVYGLLGAGAAAIARGADLAVSPVRAGLTLALFGFLAAAGGALAASGAFDRLAARLSTVVRDAIRAGVVAALLMLGAGAVLAGVTTAVNGGDASQTLASYGTGVAGQAGLTLVCLAYAPNVAVWSASYLIGPGFAVGVDTTVRTSDVTLGALPAVPVFAGLPADPVGGAWMVLLGAPLAAGMLAGWLLARRRLRERPRRNEPPATWPRLLGAAALAGPVAGVVLGTAAYASAGPLGAGRLAVMGPVAWQVALVATGVVALGAVLGAASARAATARA